MFKPKYYCKENAKEDKLENALYSNESAELKLIVYKFISVSRLFSQRMIDFVLNKEDEKKYYRGVGMSSNPMLILIFVSLIMIVSSFSGVMYIYNGNYINGGIAIAIFFILLLSFKSSFVEGALLRVNFDDASNNHRVHTYLFLKKFNVDLFKPIGKQREQFESFLGLCQVIFTSYEHSENIIIKSILKNGYCALDELIKVNENSSDRDFLLSRKNISLNLSNFCMLIESIMYLLHKSSSGETSINRELVGSIINEFNHQDKEQVEKRRLKFKDDGRVKEKRITYLMDLLKK